MHHIEFVDPKKYPFRYQFKSMPTFQLLPLWNRSHFTVRKYFKITFLYSNYLSFTILIENGHFELDIRWKSLMSKASDQIPSSSNHKIKESILSTEKDRKKRQQQKKRNRNVFDSINEKSLSRCSCQRGLFLNCFRLLFHHIFFLPRL